MTLALQGAHHLKFVVRQHFSAPLIDTEFVGDRLGGVGMVPGEHDDAAYTVGAQFV